jgi:hypothetical protein
LLNTGFVFAFSVSTSPSVPEIPKSCLAGDFYLRIEVVTYLPRSKKLNFSWVVLVCGERNCGAFFFNGGRFRFSELTFWLGTSLSRFASSSKEFFETALRFLPLSGGGRTYCE